MKHFSFYLLSSALFILLLFLFFGCKKPDEVGTEVLPSFDLLSTPFSDTATIQVITAKEDTLRSDELSKALLGSSVDPDFGLSSASIYAQVLLGNTPTLLNSTSDILIVDSLILSLAYDGYYGDTTTQQALHIYSLMDDIYHDSAYYSGRTFNYDNTKDWANNFQFTPHPFDSVVVGSSKQRAQLRVPLDTALASTLVTLANQYQTNDTWKNYFKGIYIKTDDAVSGGSILYFDPLSILSGITLYYRDSSTTSGIVISKNYSFLLNGARISHHSHDYTGSTAATLLADSSFTNTDTVAYLQSMSGLKVKVKFPYLKHFLDSGNILINKAELVLTVPSYVLTDKYSPPSNILFTAFDSTGTIKFIPDYYESIFGGAISSNVYKFNITRQLQQVLDGKLSDYNYSVNILSAGVQANRVVIGTGNSLGSKMKLRLFYTKLK